jgi:hypothetical protein
MIIVGCDYHPGFQQIAFVDSDTGELQERRLQHREEAEEFYRDLAAGMKVRAGMEASGHASWFEGLLGELHFELWVGDAAEIRNQTAVAPALDGCKRARADDEPTVGRGARPGPALQEAVVARSGTEATGSVPTDPMAGRRRRSAGVAGSTDSDDGRADTSDRAGGREMS